MAKFLDLDGLQVFKNKMVEYVNTTKQDKITSSNKLSYSLVSGTPAAPSFDDKNKAILLN